MVRVLFFSKNVSRKHGSCFLALCWKTLTNQVVSIIQEFSSPLGIFLSCLRLSNNLPASEIVKWYQRLPLLILKLYFYQLQCEIHALRLMVIPNSRAIINNKKTSEQLSEILNESRWRQRCFQLTLNIIMRRSLSELKNNFKIGINNLVVCSNDSFNEILEHMNLFFCIS